MSERTTLATALVCLLLGYRLPQDIGSSGLMAILAIGWLIYFVWTFVAYRRGEPVFVWQKR